MLVDYVVPYVNMNDKRWQILFKRYTHKDVSKNIERYRDYGTLKYQFRGIDKFIPWIRHVYLVLQSPSQIPDWINTDHPKLKIVYHKDFIPKEFLPTFNSSVIEMWYNRIPGISNYFLVSNDDMIPIKPFKLEDYFRNGKPVYASKVLDTNTKLTRNGVWDHIHFNSRKLSSWLNGKRNIISYSCPHLIMPHTLEIWNEVWKKGKSFLIKSMENSKTRKIWNANHWLFRYYAIIAKKAILDMSIPHTGSCGIDSDEALERLKIIMKDASSLCINDGGYKGNNLSKKIDDLFKDILSEKSSFEK